MIFALCCIGIPTLTLMVFKLLTSDFGDEFICGLMLLTFGFPVILILIFLNWPR